MATTPNHAAPEVEAAIRRHQLAMNASRYIPPTPEIYKEVSIKNRLYIFNVGPWPHIREMGSAGTVRIPACPPDKEYSEPVTVEGVVEEPYPINEVECKMLQTEGKDMAGQIMGEGPHVPRSSSFRPFGVFVSHSKVPTKEELAVANKHLYEKYVELVNAAADAYSKGPKEAAEVIRPEWHFVAARELKKTAAECPWMANAQAPEARNECPSCGSIYRIGIMKCNACGFILDKKRFDQAVKDGLFA